MKKSIIFIGIILLTCITTTAFADGDPCDEYQYVKMSIVVRNSTQTIIYDLSNNGTITPPHADSVWITTGEDYTTAVLTSHAQSGEPISVSSLEGRRYYLIWVQIGECVKVCQFVLRKQNSDIEECVAPNTPIRKILRDGLIYILRGEKTYTLQGQEVK